VLILIHGNGNSLWIWNAWAEQFVRAGYRVIRFDMPPYGLSGLSSSGFYGVVATHDQLVELMDRKGIASAVLIGTANGGPPAAWYAVTHPERVSGLVLINTPFYPPVANTDTLAGQRFARRYVYPYLGQPWWASWLYVRELAGWGQAIDTRLVLHIHDLEHRIDMRDPLGAYGTSYKFDSPRWNGASISNEEMLGRVRAPTLVMWGAHSLLPASEADRLAAHLTQARPEVRIYKDGGHWLPIYRPAETAKDVLHFVATIPDFASDGDAK